MEDAGYESQIPKNNRKLIIEDTINNFTYFLVKPSDVITYVTEGVCDIGIVGKDSLIEEEKDVYELLDLEIGKCKMVMAGKTSTSIDSLKPLRIATKYPNTAKSFLQSRFPSIHITKLKGSVELGPLVGLSDVIVDVYETGSTLRANNLEVIETLFEISARLIANKASYRLRYKEINDLLSRLELRGDDYVADSSV